jgi:hypothetical protein
MVNLPEPGSYLNRVALLVLCPALERGNRHHRAASYGIALHYLVVPRVTSESLPNAGDIPETAGDIPERWRRRPHGPPIPPTRNLLCMAARRRKMAVLTSALVIVAASAATSANAAAPRYILVSGPGLRQPAVLGDWAENLTFLVSLIPPRRPSPGWRTNRPRYKLALFWGVPATPVPRDPSKASQVGWFYPAVNGRRAVVVLLVSGQDGPRIASAKTLRILDHHGILTRVP